MPNAPAEKLCAILADADSDPHDLAFIIYTSGSTGTPKGIMQEYGLYNRIMDIANELFIPYGELIFAEVAPQTFLSGVFSTVSMLNCGGTLHEISYEMARDLKALIHYFAEKQITVSFLPPLLLKFFWTFRRSGSGWYAREEIMFQNSTRRDSTLPMCTAPLSSVTRSAD